MHRRVRIHLVILLKGGGLPEQGTSHLRSSGKARGLGRAPAKHPAVLLVLRESEVQSGHS